MANIRIKDHVIDNARLMSEFDWDENTKRGLDPSKLTLGSGKKPSWICEKGHRWDAYIDHRARRGSNCPYCSNKKTLLGFNDLQSQRPDLMSEWDVEANTFLPSSVVVQSNKEAHWICPKGHKYTKKIYLRALGQSCKFCSQGMSTSFPEQCFFYYTLKVFPDAVSRYKDVFDNQMELDIYIPSAHTGVEYDGFFWHDKNDKDVQAREERKYQICKENSIRLLRIKEGTVNGHADAADKVWYIPKNFDYASLNSCITEYLQFLVGDDISSLQVDIEKDKNTILEYKTLKYEKSLAFLYPDIAKEWHQAKNGNLTPDLFTPGSSENVWWLCSNCGNEWQSIIANRAKGHGCDICADPIRRLNHKKAILAKRGSIDKEWCLQDWDYEANAHGPEFYSNGSGECVHWRCHICGHKWQAVICDRTRDYRNGCPLCAGKIIVSGVNDLFTLHPELMSEWYYENNAGVDPTAIGVGSREYVSWKCQKCGYIWPAQVYNRANGKGCPCCANRIVVPGINDLATTDPEIAKDWHPKLNALKPTEVTRGQSTQIYWLCSKCGNEWQDSLNHRSGGRGCSQCNKIERQARKNRYQLS